MNEGGGTVPSSSCAFVEGSLSTWVKSPNSSSLSSSLSIPAVVVSIAPTTSPPGGFGWNERVLLPSKDGANAGANDGSCDTSGCASGIIMGAPIPPDCRCAEGVAITPKGSSTSVSVVPTASVLCIGRTPCSGSIFLGSAPDSKSPNPSSSVSSFMRLPVTNGGNELMGIVSAATTEEESDPRRISPRLGKGALSVGPRSEKASSTETVLGVPNPVTWRGSPNKKPGTASATEEG